MKSWKSKKRRIVAGVAAILFVFVLWRLQAPNFRFALAKQVVDRHDTFLLASLARDLSVVHEWSPEFLQSSKLHAFALWMDRCLQMPENATAGDVRDFVRFDPTVSPATATAEQLAASDGNPFRRVNGQLNLLHTHSEGHVHSMRDLTLSELEDELRRRLERCRRALQDAHYHEIASRRAYSRLLSRCDASPFPVRAAPLRSIASAITGWRLMDRERWAQQFIEAVERDVQPAVERYAAVDRLDTVPLDASKQLMLRRRSDHHLPATVYRGADTTTDFDLLWLEASASRKDAATSAGSQVHDTGVRFVCLPWTRDNEGSFQPQWPPAEHLVKCDLKQLQVFLVSWGLPSRCVVKTSTRAVPTFRDGEPKVALQLVLSSEDFPQWNCEATLSLEDHDVDSLRKALAEMKVQWRQKLLAYAGTVKSMGDCDVDWELSSERLVGAIDHERLGKIRVEGALDGKGRFFWKPLLNQQERQRIIQELVKLNPKLRGAEPSLAISRLEIDTKTQSLEIRCVATTVMDGEVRNAPIRARFSLADRQEVNTTIPDNLSDFVEQDGKPGTGSETDRDDRESFASTLGRLLDEKYAALKPHLEPRVNVVDEGAQVRLGLSISDWPPLHLGPVEIQQPSQLEGALKELLSHRSVVQASEQQWPQDEPWQHPKYGLVRATVVDWDPLKPTAQVRWRLQVGIHPLPGINERYHLSGPAWTGLDESNLADDMRTVTSGLLEKLLAQAMPGGILEVEPDPTGIDGIRWMSLNPVRMSFQVRGHVPLGDLFPNPLPLSVRNIRIDDEGVHLPEEWGFELPFTITTPYLALSQPGIWISGVKPSVRLGGKFTPPSPPGINPWLPIIHVPASLRGYFKQPRLDGDVRLNVVNSADVAQGAGVLDGSRKSLVGELRGGGRLPGFDTIPAKAAGRLEASGAEKTVRLEGAAEVLELDLATLELTAGDQNDNRMVVDRRFDQEKRGFSVHGHVGFPMGINAKLHGQTDSTIEKYTVVGSGRLLNLTRTMIADENEVRWENCRQSDQGKVFWMEWSPTTVAVGNVASEQEMRVGMGRAATPSDIEFARRVFQDDDSIIRWPKKPGQTGKGDSPYREVANVRAILSKKRGRFICIEQNPEDDSEREIVVVPIPSLPAGFGKGWIAAVHELVDPPKHPSQPAGLLALLSASGDGYWFEFQSPESIGPRKHSQLEAFPGMKSVSPSLRRALISRQLTLTVYQKATDSLDDIRLLNPKLEIVAFDYQVPESEAEITELLWVEGEKPCLVPIHGAESGSVGPSNVDEGLAKMVSEHESRLRDSHKDLPAAKRVVWADGDRHAVGWYIATSRRKEDGRVIVTRKTAEGEWQQSDLLFSAISDHELSFDDRLEQSRLLAQATVSRPNIAKGRAIFGRQGVIVEDGESWWIVIDGGGADVQVSHLKRSDFVRWTDPSSKTLLPSAWSDELREKLTVEEVAALALSGRYHLADPATNPANWLGLLRTLASKTSQGPSNE